jgi:hypothetical protein
MYEDKTKDIAERQQTIYDEKAKSSLSLGSIGL